MPVAVTAAVAIPAATASVAPEVDVVSPKKGMVAAALFVVADYEYGFAVVADHHL